MTVKVMPELLRKAAAEILRGLGAESEEATIVANALVGADMRGIDTHGVHLLGTIAERVKLGLVTLPTAITLVEEGAATAVLDGGNGLGQLAAYRAMVTSIRKAGEIGLGCSLVRNTNNIGSLALYTLMATREGMVGIVMCNAASAMSPWGGTGAFFGTNPLSIAVPGGDGEAPVVLDMSSTTVARGKIRKADRLKEPIPEGWAFDPHGLPTREPAAALKGTLAPVGGPKGYGLAMMVDVLSGLLSGSKFGPAVKTFHEPEGPTGVGAFTLAIDIERFMPRERFNELITPYLASVKATAKAPGVERIYLPGEIESEREKKSLEEGIELSEAVVGTLNGLLGKAGSAVRIGQEVLDGVDRESQRGNG